MKIPYTKPLDVPEPSTLTADDLYGIDVDTDSASIDAYSDQSIAHIPTIFTGFTHDRKITHYSVVPFAFEMNDPPLLSWSRIKKRGYVSDSGDAAYASRVFRADEMDEAIEKLIEMSVNPYYAWVQDVIDVSQKLTLTPIINRAGEIEHVDLNAPTEREIVFLERLVRHLQHETATHTLDNARAVMALDGHGGDWAVDEGRCRMLAALMVGEILQVTLLSASQDAREAWRLENSAQKRADAMEARAAAALAWRAAIDDKLVLFNEVASDDPKESLRRLIDWETRVALDPSVSEAAAALIATEVALVEDLRAQLESAQEDLVAEREMSAGRIAAVVADAVPMEQALVRWTDSTGAERMRGAHGEARKNAFRAGWRRYVVQSSSRPSDGVPWPFEVDTEAEAIDWCLGRAEPHVHHYINAQDHDPPREGTGAVCVCGHHWSPLLQAMPLAAASSWVIGERSISAVGLECSASDLRRLSPRLDLGDALVQHFGPCIMGSAAGAMAMTERTAGADEERAAVDAARARLLAGGADASATYWAEMHPFDARLDPPDDT